MSSFYIPYALFFEIESLTEPGLADLSRLAGQGAAGFLLFSPP